MLTNLFLRCVPQAGTPIERAGHLQVSMALLGDAFELPCPLALLPCELASGQDLLRLLSVRLPTADRERAIWEVLRDAWIYDPRCAKGSLMSMVTNGGVEIAAGHFRGFVGVGTQCDRNFFL